MIALIKEEKKAPSPFIPTVIGCNPIRSPLTSRRVSKPKWLVPVLEPQLELHRSLKFGVWLLYMA